MEFAEANGITHSPIGEQNVGSVHSKSTQPKTFLDGACLGRLADTRKISFAEYSLRPAGSRLFQPPKKILSRKERKERKVMEGGNGVREANGITHSPIGEQNVEKCAFQIDAAENLPRMDSALGVLLDGESRQEMRKLPKISFVELPDSPAGSRASSPAEEKIIISEKMIFLLTSTIICGYNIIKVQVIEILSKNTVLGYLT